MLKAARRLLSRNNEAFLQASAAPYVEQMYAAWQRDPGSVHVSWQAYFRNVAAGAAPGQAFRAPPTLIPDHDLVPAQFAEGLASYPNPSAASSTEILDHMKVQMLVRAYQVRGHHLANLDPLGIMQADLSSAGGKRTPEVEPSFYGFSDADLDRTFHLGPGVLPGFSSTSKQLTLRQIIQVCKDTYCTSSSNLYIIILVF